MNRTLSFSRLAKGGLVALLACLIAAPNALARTSKHPDTLVVATTYDAKTLDPYMTNDVASSNAMRQIYETLVAIDAEGNVIPSLAEKIDRVDGKTYRFTLKKGVTFQRRDPHRRRCPLQPEACLRKRRFCPPHPGCHRPRRLQKNRRPHL